MLKFKFNNGNAKLSTQFCLESISDEFHATQFTEVSLGGNLYNFSVNYNTIGKSDILSI